VHKAQIGTSKVAKCNYSILLYFDLFSVVSPALFYHFFSYSSPPCHHSGERLMISETGH